MKTYNVQVVAEFYKDYEIEAESESHASEMAMEIFNSDESSGWDSFEATATEINK